MNKLLLMASMWTMIFLPLRAARASNPLRGLSGVVALSLLLNLIWAVVVVAWFATHVSEPQTLLPPTEELSE